MRVRRALEGFSSHSLPTIPPTVPRDSSELASDPAQPLLSKLQMLLRALRDRMDRKKRSGLLVLSP